MKVISPRGGIGAGKGKGKRDEVKVTGVFSPFSFKRGESERGKGKGKDSLRDRTPNRTATLQRTTTPQPQRTATPPPQRTQTPPKLQTTATSPRDKMSPTQTVKPLSQMEPKPKPKPVTAKAKAKADLAIMDAFGRVSLPSSASSEEMKLDSDKTDIMEDKGFSKWIPAPSRAGKIPKFTGLSIPRPKQVLQGKAIAVPAIPSLTSSLAESATSKISYIKSSDTDISDTITRDGSRVILGKSTQSDIFRNFENLRSLQVHNL